MLISYNWLQRYFKKKLPTAEKVAEILTFSVFEIESVEKKNDDFVLDVKVLPDRAHYALCHHGIACELAAALSVQVRPIQNQDGQVRPVKTLAQLRINIESEKDCRRYIGRRVENVAVRLLHNEISKD